MPSRKRASARDLGAEKFLDIKCRMAGLKPDAVVVVATVRALKHHGGAARAELGREDLAALGGTAQPAPACGQYQKTYLACPCVVAINAFPTDTAAELRLVEEKCRELG